MHLTVSKIDDSMLASIHDLLSHRIPGAASVMKDDLHLAREKAEILERRMKQREYDEAQKRRLDLEKLR